MQVYVTNSSNPFDFSQYFIVDTKDDYCTVLSSDRILVFKMENSNFKVIQQSVRPPNDIEENGPNQWAKFITKENIVYGTSNGAFFLFNVKTNACKEIKTGFNVTDVFINSSEEKICICVVGPKLVLLSKDGDAIESIPFNAQTQIIKNITFCDGNYYFCCCANLYKTDKKQMLEQKEAELISEGVLMLRSDEKTLATCDVSGSIYNISNREGKIEKKKVGETKLGAMFVEITKNGVLYIDWDGVIHRNGKTIENKEIINSMCINYDSKNDRLLFLHGRNIHFVSLDSLMPENIEDNSDEIQTPNNTEEEKITNEVKEEKETKTCETVKEEKTSNEIKEEENQSKLNKETAKEVKEEEIAKNVKEEKQSKLNKETTKNVKEENQSKLNEETAKEVKEEEIAKNVKEEKQSKLNEVNSNIVKEEEIAKKGKEEIIIKTKEEENSNNVKEEVSSSEKNDGESRKESEGNNFSSLSEDKKIEMLMKLGKDEINSLIENERDALLAISERESIVDNLIKEQRWVRSILVADALDVSLNERVEKCTSLASVSFEDCVLSIQKDTEKWKDVSLQITLLAFAFNMSELFRWSLAAFTVNEDQGKVRVILSDNRELFGDVVEFTRDNPENKATIFLKDLNLGF